MTKQNFRFWKNGDPENGDFKLTQVWTQVKEYRECEEDAMVLVVTFTIATIRNIPKWEMIKVSARGWLCATRSQHPSGIRCTERVGVCHDEDVVHVAQRRRRRLGLVRRLALVVDLGSVTHISHFQHDFNQRLGKEVGLVTGIRGNQIVAIRYTTYSLQCQQSWTVVVSDGNSFQQGATN